MTQASAPPLEPFEASFEGFAAGQDWPNTVTVKAVSVYAPAPDIAAGEEDEAFADSHGERQLVEVDTNYKSSRPGQHPVALTRADAVRFAAAVLGATEDTFHYTRVGELRAAEAAELLRVLGELEWQLVELREHAMHELLCQAGLAERLDLELSTGEVPEATA